MAQENENATAAARIVAQIGERSVNSVANLTRQDAVDFFELARRIPVESSVQLHRFSEANPPSRLCVKVGSTALQFSR